MRVLLAANRCTTTDRSFDAPQTVCEQATSAGGAIVKLLRSHPRPRALTINAPVGLFDPSTEASQASRHGPEGKWR